MCQAEAAVQASRAGAVAASPAPQDPHPVPRPVSQAEDDDTLAAMYLRMWSLATGRRLRPGVRLEHLTEGELIAFWSDDLSPVPGRHAAPDPGDTGNAR